MAKEELLRLSQIYNTLCLCQVSGESAINMGKSLEALKEFILIKEQEIKITEGKNQPVN